MIVTKAVAIQVYIEVTDFISVQKRIIHHIIPIFTCDVIYDIHPLKFEAGIHNEFEVICKRPDGKSVEIRNIIVTVRIMANEHGEIYKLKIVKIKHFYTRYVCFNQIKKTFFFPLF